MPVWRGAAEPLGPAGGRGCRDPAGLGRPGPARRKDQYLAGIGSVGKGRGQSDPQTRGVCSHAVTVTFMKSSLVTGHLRAGIKTCRAPLLVHPV